MILEGKDVVLIPRERFDYLSYALQRIAEPLAKRNRVMYVNPAILLSRNPLKNLRLAARALAVGGCRIRDGLTIYTPIFWPRLLRSKDTTLEAYCSLLGKRAAGKAMALGLNPNVVITDYWTHTPTMENFPDALKVYWKQDMPLLDEELLIARQADLIFALSEMQYQSVAAHFPEKSHFVPQPCEIPDQDFSTQHGPAATPSQLRQVPSPIVGFVGSINRRLDFDLIVSGATGYPRWSFVFIGPVHNSSRSAVEAVRSQCTNVYFLGSKPIHELPKYIASFDLCIIPYVINTFNTYSDPLKLYDYFALGKVVVSTPIPAVEQWGEVVLISRAPDEFGRCLGQAYERRDEADQAERRQAIVRSRSTASILSLIDDILVQHASRLAN